MPASTAGGAVEPRERRGEADAGGERLEEGGDQASRDPEPTYAGLYWIRLPLAFTMPIPASVAIASPWFAILCFAGTLFSVAIAFVFSLEVVEVEQEQGSRCNGEVPLGARDQSTAVGPGAVFGRMGGEEFACLLPRLDERAAMRVAEDVRAAIATRSRPACLAW
jgi:hypothetical protein